MTSRHDERKGLFHTPHAIKPTEYDRSAGAVSEEGMRRLRHPFEVAADESAESAAQADDGQDGAH